SYCSSGWLFIAFFFFSSRRRHTRSKRDWSSDVCSSDLNRSQLLCYLNRPRFINLGGLHAIPQCPLFRKSWHTHMKIVRCLLQFFIFVVAHTKFNLSIIFPVLSHKSHLV